MLEDTTRYPVFIDNDAQLGTLAVRNFGVGQGLDDFIYVSGGSSGIGGGVLTDGNVISGRLEAEATRSALLEVLDLEDADSDELERALLASTSPKVRAVVEYQLDCLAIVLSNIVNVLNPDLSCSVVSWPHSLPLTLST